MAKGKKEEGANSPEAENAPAGDQPQEGEGPQPWDSDYSSEWSDDDKPLKKHREKDDRRHEMEKIYDHYDVCGMIDITLVGGHDLVKKVKGKTPGNKVLYCKISLSWPPWIPIHKSEYAVTEEGEDQVYWNDSFGLQKIYTRGGEDVKNAWLKYPKIIIKLKQKTGKISRPKQLSQGEIFMGRIIQPRDDAVLEKSLAMDGETLVIPMLTKTGDLQGEIDVKVKFSAGVEQERPEEDKHAFDHLE